MLEVIDVVSEIMLANVSNVQPVFLITGLNPGRDLRLVVYAINKNGRSEATVMEGFTTKVAQLQVGELIIILSSCQRSAPIKTVFIAQLLLVNTNRKYCNINTRNFSQLSSLFSIKLRIENFGALISSLIILTL